MAAYWLTSPKWPPARTSGMIKPAASTIAYFARAKAELDIPHPAELIKVTELTPREKVFEFKFKDGRKLGQRPGQFVEVSLLGIGEAPISVSSAPGKNGSF